MFSSDVSILNEFNGYGWHCVIDYGYIADLGRQFSINCTGVTSYADKSICISEAAAILHEFGRFFGSILNDSVVFERLYCVDVRNFSLRGYAKNNAAEYFADFFDYWINNRQSIVKMIW